MEFNETRPFGIEIEACGIERGRLAGELSAQGIPTRNEGYSHQTTDYWKVVTDSSVHGRFPFELVSPKLYGQDGLREVERVMRIVRELGGRVNRSCGLHIHHSAQELSPKQARMVSHFYSALYDCFNSIFSLSRHHNVYAAVDNAQRVHQMRDGDMRTANRGAVNLTAIFRHGTIEFRQHQGSLNGTKATSWIVFTQQFMLGALRSKKSVSWRKQNLRVGLFNFWGLYNKGETIDEPCERMLRFMGKRVQPRWQVGRMIAARRRTPFCQSCPAPMVVAPTFDEAAMTAAIRDRIFSQVVS